MDAPVVVATIAVQRSALLYHLWLECDGTGTMRCVAWSGRMARPPDAPLPRGYLTAVWQDRAAWERSLAARGATVHWSEDAPMILTGQAERNATRTPTTLAEMRVFWGPDIARLVYLLRLIADGQIQTSMSPEAAREALAEFEAASPASPAPTPATPA